MFKRSLFKLGVFPALCLAIVSLFANFGVPVVHAAPTLYNGVAQTPPMGWNSWNHFQCNISEALIKREADAMVSSGMKAAGYQYVNIDDCWATGRDSSGNIVADPNAFPDGMKALADYVHNDGLKLGIYTDAGTETCAGRPGSLGHEQQDANTYASWGIDYVKEDWCNTSGLDPQTQYTIMRNALNATGRPIVLSLCDWGVNSPWIWGGATGNLWRTTGDIQDNWSSMLSNLDSSSQHASFAGPGAWNDPDMLEVGNGGMTTTEDQAHFSLWAEMAAPLIAGNDLATMASSTQTIVTNPEVIAVDQDPLGSQGALVADNGHGLQVWSKNLLPVRYPYTAGTWEYSRAVVLFNRSSSAANMTVYRSSLDLPSGSASVRDLWAHATLGSFNDSYTANVPAHGVVMLKITDISNGLPYPSLSCSSLTGFYAIMNRSSGKYLDVFDDSTSDDAPIVQFSANGQADQEWSFQDAGGGYCKIVNRNSGKLLNVPGPTTTAGTQLIQYHDDGNANSQWLLTLAVSGAYTIASRYDNQFVDDWQSSTNDNSPIIQWPNNEGINQQWQLILVTP